MTILHLTDLTLDRKRILMREDLNVPMEDGKITSDARILSAIPSIEHCLRQNASVMILSHLGRPTEGNPDPQYSLKPVADHLGHLLGQPIRFVEDWLEKEIAISPGEVIMLENVRFNPGEKANDPALAQKMAALCDIFVMDAFATAHRRDASTYGVAEYAPIACAGPLLLAELKAIHQALKNPKHPFVAIVGGSKVSSKLQVLESLLTTVDQLIVGGGIANTFIAASGFSVGKSLYEPALIPQAQHLIQLAVKRGAAIPIPSDVIVAKHFAKDAQPILRNIEDVQADEMILDMGPKTAAQLAIPIESAGTIVWNGPVGVFEWEAFSQGTHTLAAAIAQSQAFSIAGGGDTLAAIDKYAMADRLSYISTGGGAFLECIEGKTLPAIAALEKAAARLQSTET
jgi:phosphoglycerate kinase